MNAVCPGGTRTELLERVMTDNPILRDQIIVRRRGIVHRFKW